MILPVLFLALFSFNAWIVICGFRTGTMEGVKDFRAERESQPFGFWAATVWKITLMGFCLWGAIASAINR